MTTFPKIKNRIYKRENLYILELETWVRIKRNKKYYKIRVFQMLSIDPNCNYHDFILKILSFVESFTTTIYNTYHLYMIEKDFKVSRDATKDNTPLSEKDIAYIKSLKLIDPNLNSI